MEFYRAKTGEICFFVPGKSGTCFLLRNVCGATTSIEECDNIEGMTNAKRAEERELTLINGTLDFIQNHIEIRSFQCPACQARDNPVHIFPDTKAMRLECHACYQVFWWAHHLGKLFEDMTRRELPELHFMLLDKYPAPPKENG